MGVLDILDQLTEVGGWKDKLLRKEEKMKTNVNQINVNRLRVSLETWKQNNVSDLTAKVRQIEGERNHFAERRNIETFKQTEILIDIDRKADEKKDISKFKNYNYGNQSFNSGHLLELIKDKPSGDLYILNTDEELLETIRVTFEKHGCTVAVTQLERNLTALFVLLKGKISMKRLRRLAAKGHKFGLEFFLTKTGLSTSLLSRVRNILTL